MSQSSAGGGFRHVAFILSSAVLAIAATSCGGGGSSGTVPAPVATATQAASGKEGQVRFVITWPAAPASSSTSSHRKRDYLSNSTASITIAVNSGTPLSVNNPNLTPGTTSAGTQTTTVVNVDAPIGDDTFTVDDYDATDGAGNLLAANSIPYDVVIDTANTVPITLDGNLGKIACAPIAPFVSGTAPTFTLVGPAGAIALEPEDADGNIIVAPGAIPALTLSSTTTGAALIKSTSTTNQYIVNPQKVGTATSLTASGTNLTGTTVNSTCSITRELAMYVANHGVVAANPAIDIYSLEAPSSTETPTAIIAGSNTEENAIQFPAVDNFGNLYVSNQGPMPGATFAPTSGYVAAYAPAASGNVAPTSLITGLNRPTGLSIDLNNNLYSTTALTVNVYPAQATGSTAPTYVLDYGYPFKPYDTNPSNCYGNYVDANGLLYMACSNSLLVFAAGASGTAAPVQTILYTGGSTVASSASWIGVAADSTTGAAGDIFAPASNNNLNMLDVYDAGTTGDGAPSSVVAGTFSQPLDIYISPTNPTGGAYVTDFATQSVEIFASSTTLMTGVASETITIPSGPGTGTAAPYGVTVE